MFKKIIITIIFVLLLTGCSTTKEVPVIFENHSIKQLDKKFQYQTGKCLRNDVMAQYLTLNRDDVIEIENEDDSFYYFSSNDILLAILKDFVRTENEEPFEPFTGYARSGRGIYTNYDLEERIEKLSLNDEVNVIDGFLGVYYVEYEGTYGYMDSDSISKSKISTYVAPKVTEQVPTSDGGSSHSHHDDGGGGGSSDPSPIPSVTDTEGGEVRTDELCNENNYYYDVPLVLTNKLSGKVLIDGAVAYLTVFQRDDVLCIINDSEEFYDIIFAGRKAKVLKDYVRLDSEAQYEEWIGYTHSSSVYSDYDLENRIGGFDTNDQVKVIDKVKNIYVVELEDGTIGYMNFSSISEEKIYIAPKKVEVETPATSDGGSSHSHHDDGGGSPAPAPAPVSDDSDWGEAVR